MHRKYNNTVNIKIERVQKMCIEIEKSEGLREQDVLTWLSDFANAMGTCGYE